MLHSAFSLFSFIHQEISNGRIFLKSWVKVFSDPLSVSYMSLLICFPSHVYEWIIKARKIGQHQSVSPSPVLLKHLTCQILCFTAFLLLLVCSLSLNSLRILESRFLPYLVSMLLLISIWYQTSVSSISLALLLAVS